MELIMKKAHIAALDNLQVDIIRSRVKELKKFYSHLFIYVIGVLVYISKTYFDLPINFWPINFINEFFMLVWTFVIGVQAVSLFLMQRLFGSKWEEQKINEMMEKEKSETTKWN
jgi:uncharacterized protein YacL